MASRPSTVLALANGVQGNGVKVGNGTRMGNGTRIGNGTRLGNGIDLGALGVGGNELVGEADDGTPIYGDAFVGAKLEGLTDDGATVELTIDAFERQGDVALYRLD